MSKLKTQLAVKKELFRGGMATLSLAVTPEGKQVVLRRLLPMNVLNWPLRQGFIQGTRIRAAITPHPQIVDSIEYGFLGDVSAKGVLGDGFVGRLLSSWVPCEIIEYVDGVNLKNLMQKRDPDVNKYTFEILRQAAAGLAHLHGKGYMHMDVKPENLMVHKLENGMEVKLTDFDLSRPAEKKKLESTGGTELYVPPEQLVEKIISPASDVFAFGVMAYSLITGKMPFQGTTELERKQRQISRTFMPAEPIAIKPELSPKLNKVIMHCLEKVYEKRLPNMTYVNAELR
ncbi:MAG: hypothetical protein A3K19_09465 [Lentisphaerae bacterium RIFOXYB12_FULL_65_16]|nr:MAG: hypothetical protein A3K18_03485 [Lentisphaerae bacterium RIFOXYA12_64_32]OGV90479.1 MAG: hypothetical protein A3K19_09465 [Lentisphaerae bacterium RIFOXYB12_FULL_65_16]